MTLASKQTTCALLHKAFDIEKPENFFRCLTPAEGIELRKVTTTLIKLYSKYGGTKG